MGSVSGNIDTETAERRRHRPRTCRWGTTCVVPHRMKMFGGVLLSHAVTRAVPSAQKGLASGFGMEPGVSPSPWPPKLYGDMTNQPQPHPHPPTRRRGREWCRVRVSARISGAAQWTRSMCGQVLGLLVPVSSDGYPSSTSGLSTRWSTGGLTPRRVGDLILKRASRLDAFSGYPCRT